MGERVSGWTGDLQSGAFQDSPWPTSTLFYATEQAKDQNMREATSHCLFSATEVSKHFGIWLNFVWFFFYFESKVGPLHSCSTSSFFRIGLKRAKAMICIGQSFTSPPSNGSAAWRYIWIAASVISRGRELKPGQPKNGRKCRVTALMWKSPDYCK